MKIFQERVAVFFTLATLLALTCADLGISEGFSSGSGDGGCGDDEPDGSVAPLAKLKQPPMNFNDWLIKITKGRKLPNPAAQKLQPAEPYEGPDPYKSRASSPGVNSPPHANGHHIHIQKHKEDSFGFRFHEIEVEMNHHSPKKHENRDRILNYIYNILKLGKEDADDKYEHHMRSATAKTDESLDSSLKKEDAAVAPLADTTSQNKEANCSSSDMEISPPIVAGASAELQNANATEQSNENANTTANTSTSPNSSSIEA